MAKTSDTTAPETPEVPAAPLLSPAPKPLIQANVIAATAKAPRRQVVDAFKAPTKEQKVARQSAKEVRDLSAQLLTQVNTVHDRITLFLKSAEADPDVVEEAAKEGLNIGAARNLQAALGRVLDEFMPAHKEA